MRALTASTDDQFFLSSTPDHDTVSQLAQHPDHDTVSQLAQHPDHDTVSQLAQHPDHYFRWPHWSTALDVSTWSGPKCCGLKIDFTTEDNDH
ncbi:hypothetical protein RRG08_042043 [Elysia crispata]|uniref:Uncharacterized protein n=1 Tax=Elysia crispata TaxID=231223 RepID=A0AAE0Z8H1_9GAST|nr:hypothetical protein RRG08_042043 [Elysia crispata]